MNVFQRVFRDMPCGDWGDRADEIIADVSRDSGVPVDDIISSARDHITARARQYCMWRIRNEIGGSLPQIGKLFDRDHTTVIHAIKRIEHLIGDGE